MKETDLIAFGMLGRFWVCSCLLLALPFAACRQDSGSTLMEMNDPKYLLARSGPWGTDSTRHFDFYFYEGIDSSFAESIKTAQEANYSRITKSMGLENADGLPRIQFWLFRDKDEKIKKTKVSSDAHALPPYSSVYHLPRNALGGQEVGHILTASQWGFIKNSNGLSLLVDEGFNFYIDEETFWVPAGSAPFDSVAVMALSNKEYCRRHTVTHLAHESEDGNWDTSQAKVAGAFVRFIIDQYGTKRFGDLWRGAKGKKETDLSVFEPVYGKPLDQLGKEFYEHLGLNGDPCTSM